MKKFIFTILSTSVLMTCGTLDKKFESKTKDHLVIGPNDNNYVIFENLDDGKIYYSKCNSSELMRLEKIYAESGTNSWNASRNNLCHIAVAGTSGISKSDYLNKIWDLLDVGSAAEARAVQSLDTLIAQINAQITEFDGTERQILNQLSEIERQATQLSNDINTKRQDQSLTHEVLNFLIDRLATDNNIDDAQLVNLRASIKIHQTKIQTIDTEISALQLRIDTLRGSESNTVRKRLEDIRNELVKKRQSLKDSNASREAEINKVRALRKPSEDSLKAGKVDILKVNSTVAIPIIEKMFNARTARLNSSGLLEVFKDNEWRGVCDDNFEPEDATVACRHLGFSTVVKFEREQKGPHANFWLDDLNCNPNPNATDLFQCSYQTEDCNEGEWIKLECK